MIFYINTDFDNYISLFSLVRIWTTQCLLFQVHCQMVQSYARSKKIWQSSCHNKPLRQEMKQDGCWSELSMWMTSCPEEMSWEFWGFWNAVLVEFDRLCARFNFSDLIRWGQFGSLPAEILNTTKCAALFGWTERCMVSIGLYDSSLPPRVSKERSQKLINPIHIRNDRVTLICICTIIIFIIDVHSHFMSIKNNLCFDYIMFLFSRPFHIPW